MTESEFVSEKYGPYVFIKQRFGYNTEEKGFVLDGLKDLTKLREFLNKLVIEMEKID